MTYRLDTTHAGVRWASLGALAAGGVLGTLVIIPAVTSVLGVTKQVPFLLSCAGGLILGIAAGWLAERYLRAAWPSGRWLLVDEQGCTLRERSGEATRISWSEPVDVLAWHFLIRDGKKWVPKGWCCVACRLSQGGKAIIPYAFMKPAVAEAMAQWNGFPELISLKHAPDEHVRKLTGAQEQLRAAEEDRWNYGAEMAPADFAALAAELDRRLPGWPG